MLYDYFRQLLPHAEFSCFLPQQSHSMESGLLHDAALQSLIWDFLTKVDGLWQTPDLEQVGMQNILPVYLADELQDQSIFTQAGHYFSYHHEIVAG